jgi:cellulose synthase/poly-beta-1,6-N-acetylglucosamine synthase-like glycosyltransferase
MSFLIFDPLTKENIPLDSVKKSERQGVDTAVLIPTYRPDRTTYNFIKSLTQWHPDILVIVIDDSTPLTKENRAIIDDIVNLSSFMNQVVYMRTSNNKLKSGALNMGVQYLRRFYKDITTVFTSDDDVVINAQTIPFMKQSLLADDGNGAVCSMVRVVNKDKNVITRLQGLEYHSFNVTKIADNSLFAGPMVMQGMFTCFRMQALEESGGFSEEHLIEDYEMTAKLKVHGWNVKIEKNAYAGTIVPESIGALWKQRIRWNCGGIKVVLQYRRNITTVFQDLIGHAMFLMLAVLLIVASFVNKEAKSGEFLLQLLLSFFLVNFALTTVLNAFILTSYKDRDLKDAFLKLTILPEFIYANILSIVLAGAYLFYLYQYLTKVGLHIFNRLGYSSGWGTRQEVLKGGAM